MSRFYTASGVPQYQVPVKDGSKLRNVTITDAKKHDWVASVSTICGLLSESDYLTTWKINQYMDAAIGLGELLSTNHSKWVEAVHTKAEKQMSKAPALGSAVHKVVEQYHTLRAANHSLAGLKDVERTLKPYVVAIHDFCEEHNIKAVDANSIERTISVPGARSAGTCDLVGSYDEQPTVLFDWKTQKVKREPYFYYRFPLQLAAYWAGSGSVGRICSVIIDTSNHDQYSVSRGYLPALHTKFYDNILGYYQDFQALSRIYYKINDWEAQTDATSIETSGTAEAKTSRKARR